MINSSDLQPTDENIADTFLKDSISRDSDVISMAKMLDSIEGNYSIAVDGKWGSGKTFFIKQVIMLFDAFRNEDGNEEGDDKANDINAILGKCEALDKSFQPKNTVCVYYDAWGNDNDDDPVLSLVYSIIQDLDLKRPLVNISWEEIVTAAVAIYDSITNQRLSKVFESLKNGLSSGLSEIKKEKNLEKSINDFLDKISKKINCRLIIFIDELDRCNPSYAVKLLERVKHYFSHEKITFVFSINSMELEHTIRNYYGNGFDAGRYLDRFFNLHLQLPPLDINKYYNLIGFDDSKEYDHMCNVVMRTFNLSMREISHFVQLSRIVSSDIVRSSDRSILLRDSQKYCLRIFIPILIGLFLIDSDRYSKFINGEDPSPLIEISKSEYLDIYIFYDLLSNNEQFESLDVNKNLISLDDKLNQFYNAVFKYPVGRERFVSIGQAKIDSTFKNEIIHAGGLLHRGMNLQN